MGVAYGKLKKYQKAIDAFKKAIEIKPDFHSTEAIISSNVSSPLSI
jgi:tetratricopeptide (TPR) repeat protein